MTDAKLEEVVRKIAGLCRGVVASRNYFSMDTSESVLLGLSNLEGKQNAYLEVIEIINEVYGTKYAIRDVSDWRWSV